MRTMAVSLLMPVTMQRKRRSRCTEGAVAPGQTNLGSCSIHTFTIENMKKAGKLWQSTACDAANSQAFAAVFPANTSRHGSFVPQGCRHNRGQEHGLETVASTHG